MTGQSVALSVLILIYAGIAVGLVRMYRNATRDTRDDTGRLRRY